MNNPDLTHLKNKTEELLKLLEDGQLSKAYLLYGSMHSDFEKIRRMKLENKTKVLQ